jgi:hypothetical protein
VKRKVILGIALAAAGGIFAAALWLMGYRARAREFWSRSVGFAATYVPPTFAKIVYTGMRYGDGAYRILERDRASGAVRVLSEGDRTALHGVASDSAFLYDGVNGNVREWVFGTRGDGREISLEGPEALFDPNISSSGRWVASLYLNQERVGPITIGPSGALLDRIDVRDLEEDTRTSYALQSPKGALEVRLWGVAVSPDGRRLAVVYSALDGQYSAAVYDPETLSQRLLLRSQRILMRPRWRSDGRAVTIVSKESSGWAVRELPEDGSGGTLLYSTNRFIESAELHPDGRHLLLTLGDGPGFEGYFRGLHVYEIDLKTGKMARVDA